MARYRTGPRAMLPLENPTWWLWHLVTPRCCVPSSRVPFTTSTWPPSPGCCWRAWTSSSLHTTWLWSTTPAWAGSWRSSCSLWATQSQLSLWPFLQRPGLTFMEHLPGKLKFTLVLSSLHVQGQQRTHVALYFHWNMINTEKHSNLPKTSSWFHDCIPWKKCF